ncbi:hypothetical protein N836_11115 [Leptolyngbya sp. Heron Island J]|uniref:hypothetical protein n=1 Tax=Leptolyngbya sp. Heron Island J TaxID=1385935 RepID=UPI0003B9C94F|nr:hypothetical protein [Leptolyngbya sp. Heron Island J]ESA35540.1 hypothetical protein N836_11115 [Leptolyngbya sp. Heron Island J]
MNFQLTRKRIVNTLLIGTLTLGLGSFNIQNASAQLDRSAFREIAQELNLSRSQMREVGGIMQNLNSEIEDILTPEQFELLQSTREQQQTQTPQELQTALDLTDTQSVQLTVVHEETVAELQAVLTADQLERIMEMTAFGQL